MTWGTLRDVRNSLLEFVPALRARHHIVRLTTGRYTRTLGAPDSRIVTPEGKEYRTVNVKGNLWKMEAV